MSVTSCNENPEERWADAESAGCGWTIQTDNPHDNPIQFVGALQAEGKLPYIGSGHPDNPYLRCAPPYPKVVAIGAVKWKASAEYKIAFSEKEQEQQDRQDFPNPLERPAIVKKSFDRSEKAIWKTAEDEPKPILNSAGDFYLDPVVVPSSNSRWSVTCYVATSPTWMDDFAEKVNSDSITIDGETYAAEELLFEPGDRSEKKTENGVNFYEASYNLLVNKEGWKERRYQNGLNEKVQIDGQPVKRKCRLPLKDDEGNEVKYDDRTDVSDTQLLDSSGKMIENPTPEDAVEHVITKFKKVAFGSLPGIG